MADSEAVAPTTHAPFASSARGYRRYRRKVATNQSVAQKYKQYKRKPKTKVALNKNAIMTLSKQVRTLQLDKLGSQQYQVQDVHLRPTIATAQPSVVGPLCFCANNFYSDSVTSQTKCPIYKGTVNAGGTPVLTAPATQLFTKQGFSLDLQNQFQWNEYRNTATSVSAVQYLPICAKYVFTFNGSITSGDLPIRYRITFLRQKKNQLQTSARNILLPYQLGAYWRMCADDPRQRNYFSNSFHEVLYDKFLTINSPVGGGTAAQVFRRQIVARLAFPNKVLKPNLVNQTSGATDFNTNVPIKDQIWCIISSNRQEGDTSSPVIDIVRSMCWRDQHGTTQ